MLIQNITVVPITDHIFKPLQKRINEQLFQIHFAYQAS